MEVKEVLFMNKGEGESSYAHNSSFSNSQKVASMAKPIIERAVQSLFTQDFYHYKVLNIADLGCSSAPNTFSMMSTVTESVEKKCRELNCLLPEFQFYLNDLPGNDFNTLFKGLSSFLEKNKGISCFVMGAPGSFYDRLFPSNSLHLVHSCYSVHWLSQVPRHINEEGLPLNKGKIYISTTSPPAVRQAYLDQFQKDFALFLKLRSQEMVPDGRVVLILQGRQSADPASKENCHPWELLSEAIADMVQQGLIDEEKLNSFDVPYYTPSPEEVQDVVDWERSFTTELMETFALEEGDKNMRNNGKKVANNIRSFTESIIAHHFGVEILDKLYDKFTNMVIEDLAKESTKITSITVVLKRNDI